jgi:ribosomal protein S18 acetylase RimI-like enzyme
MIRISQASEKDTALISKLSHDVWPMAYGHILSQQQINYMLNLMCSEVALVKQMNEKHLFIIIYNDNVPVGFASYGEIAPVTYKLHKLYIHPEQQGKGTGKFVIHHIINDIRSKGAASLVLNVNKKNRAKEFYEKIGFKVIRSEDIDIGKGYFMNDYIMALDLNIRDQP